MVSFTLSTVLTAISFLAAGITAIPLESRQSGSVTVTFIGAADAQYSLQIPVNSQFTPTNNPLSISHISTSGGPGACFGVDGAIYVAEGAGYGDVGPPQTIVGCVFGPFPGH